MTASLKLAADYLVSAAQPWGEDETLRVPTTTLLPGGDVLCVEIIARSQSTFDVSDRGAARSAILNAGIQNLGNRDRRRGRDLAESFGIELDSDEFVARNVAPDQLAAAVSYVAEAARAWASHIVERSMRATEREISEFVGNQLATTFPLSKIKREASVLGSSNTEHRVDFAVDIDNGRLALFEIVSLAPASIAAAHLKFSDIMRSHENWPREVVVQDVANWPSESLALLSQVASHIRPTNAPWADLHNLARH